MKEINVRELLRNFKLIFPIPEDGIKVKRRGGDFYIYPSKKRKTPAPVVDTSMTHPPIDVMMHPTPTLCDWVMIMSGMICSAPADSRVKICSLQDVDSNPDNWKQVHLCQHHLNVVKASGMFSIEPL